MRFGGVDESLSLVNGETSFRRGVAFGPAKMLSRVVLEDALAYALSDKVRGNDALAVFHGIDVEMKQAAWAFLTEHWDVVFDRYGEDVHIGGFIGGAAGGTASAAFADEVEAFFEANPTPAAARMISQLLEATRLRATFLEQNADALTQFFASENVGV